MLDRKCIYCGGPIPEESASKYCSHSCRTRYSEMKRGLNGTGHGLPPYQINTPPEEQKPVIEPVLPLKPYIEGLRGIVDNTPPEEKEQQEPAKQYPQTTEQPAKEQQEPKPEFLQIQVETKQHRELMANLNETRQMQQRAQADLAKYQQRLKDITESKGNGWLYAGGATGAGTVLLNGLSLDDKGKIRFEPPSFWELVLGIVLGTAAGAGAKELTAKQREEIRRREIPKLQAEIESLRGTLKEIEQEIKELEQLEKIVPQYETRVIQRQGLLNSYDIGDFGREKEKSPFAAAWKEARQEFANKQVQQQAKPKERPKEPPVPINDKLITSHNLKEQHYPALNFQDVWGMFYGQPAVNFFLVVHGPPGEGKSTKCIRFAKYLSENFGRVAYISAEEGFSKTLRDKVERENAVNDALYYADITTYHEIAEVIPADTFHFIIIDSLDTLKIDAARMKELRERYERSAIIAISQSTKDGKMRGSQEIAHDADITVSVEKGVATTTKNRFKEKGMQMIIFDKGKDEGSSGKVIPFQPRNII